MDKPRKTSGSKGSRGAVVRLPVGLAWGPGEEEVAAR